jgi:hypothetical protein
MIKLATAATLLTVAIAAVVWLIGWALTTYAPLWLQIASLPVMVWLIVITIVTLVQRGALDRWT